jgi:hypothetical protein
VAVTDDLYERTRQEVDHFLAEKPASEDALEEVLYLISSRAGHDLGPLAGQEPDEQHAWEMLAAVDAWASLASYAFHRVYPKSLPPWVHRSSGSQARRRPSCKRSSLFLRGSDRPLRRRAEVSALSHTPSRSGIPAGVSVGVSWQP